MRDLNVAVAIATTGRAQLLGESVAEIARQTRRPAHVNICPADACDVDLKALKTTLLPVFVHAGQKGASAQRNAILRQMPAADIVLFLDDDFVMAEDYIDELAKLFIEDPCVMIATGTVLADGARGPGLSLSAARTILSNDARPKKRVVRDVFNGYGCNMAVRREATVRGNVLFDENLPLYSWAEDVDFSRRLGRYGRIVRSNRLRGVHLGVKAGRVSGLRFGYSQIANQVYLSNKGIISRRMAAVQIIKNCLANLQGLVRNEMYVDRRGRLHGNLRGLIDALKGKSSPQKILDF